MAFTIYDRSGSPRLVRNINITGNSRSRDEVIRREMRQMESSWYDGEKINRSRTRVGPPRLFRGGDAGNAARSRHHGPGRRQCQCQGKGHRRLDAGLGFSSSEKLVLSGSVQQQNMFGSGNFVGIGINSSKSNTVYSFSDTDPYYTVDGVSRGFDVTITNYDSTSLSTIGTYGAKSNGGGVRFGVPISGTIRSISDWPSTRPD